MAIYSLHLGFTSRSEGRSAVGFAAYITATKALDLRTSILYDYTHKIEVIAHGIIAPDGAPQWTQKSEALWNKVEAFEDRMAEERFKDHPHNAEKNRKSLEARQNFKNTAQTAQTVMGVIPLELTPEQAKLCVVDYLTQHFGSRNLIIEWGIHWEPHNPHFHAIVSRRALVGDDLSPLKDREVVSKEGVFKARKAWEVVANKHLELAGHEVRIDSRSHAARGSLFVPGVHERWYAQRQVEQGKYMRVVADNAAIREQNIKILCENPQAIIHEVASKRLTFTREHLHEELIRRVGGDTHLFSILKDRVDGLVIDQERILSSPATQAVYEGFGYELEKVVRQFSETLLEDASLVHPVGLNMNHQKLYTSQHLKQQEERLVSCTDQLHAQSNKVIDTALIDKAIAAREASLGSPLSTEQKAAIIHLCSGEDIRLVNGNAGTDKTNIEALKGLSEAGMSVHGSYIFGAPGETKASIQHTVDHIKSTLSQVKFSTIEVSRLFPLANSPIWDMMVTFDNPKFYKNNDEITDVLQKLNIHTPQKIREEIRLKYTNCDLINNEEIIEDWYKFYTHVNQDYVFERIEEIDRIISESKINTGKNIG